MLTDAARNHKAIGSHRGISLVEFVGCLAALGGGIVLGSIYLGVDVKTLAVGVLEKADIEVPAILDAGVSQGELVPTENSSTDISEDAAPGDPNAEEQLSELTQAEGLRALENPLGTKAPAPDDLTDEERLAATKACWLLLGDCMQQESTNRTQAITDPGNWQLFDYLLNRKQGHASAVETLEQLDVQGIDQRLATHIQQVLTWHRAGEELFDRAAQLLTDAPAGKLSGPFAQSWQSAATQHRMEEKLILNKHAAVASYLEHTQKANSASNSIN